MRKLKYYTNGIWQDSVTQKYMDVTNSSTGEIIAKAPCCTKEEVVEAIISADKAFSSWAALPITKRIQVIYKFRDLVKENLEELATLIATEQGKALREARGEVTSAIGDIEFACGTPWLSQGEFSYGVSREHDLFRIAEPVGVFAEIAPSNFPAMIPFGWTIPLCIALGNTVVLKAASAVPLTAVRMIELLEEAGLPAGVVNMVTCSRTEAEVVMTDERVRGVSYVGSSAVGKHIYEVSAAHGKRVQVMGAAKNHAIVLKDANLPVVADRIIASAFGAAGQRCQALSVVCVENAVADELISLLVDKAKQLKIGPAYKECTTLGALTTKGLQEKVLDYIKKGIEQGAKLVLDGRSVELEESIKDGNFVGATIFDDVSEDNVIGIEEIFGPVLSIKRITSFDEGVAIINKSEFANGAVLFSNNGYYMRRFVSEADAGSIGINVGIPAVQPGFPFSGHKKSFFGDLHAKGRDGIAFFTESKCVTVNWIDAEDKGGVTNSKIISCSGN